MGLLQDLVNAVGGDNLKRISAGQGNFEAPDSSDQKSLQEMVRHADPGQLRDVFAQAAQRVNPNEYSDHITPGVGGTNPLGGLGGGALGSIATILLNQLQKRGSSPAQIPGVSTQNPSEMSPTDVAAMARYAQQNHPDAFGEAASQIGQQQPGLLHSFLGKAALAVGAAALASHFIKPDRRA